MLSVALLMAARTWGEPKALCELKSTIVTESSGLAVSPTRKDTFYTHNDSGDKPRFFRFSGKGEMTGEFSLSGATALDWEEMFAVKLGGKSWIYLADCGDNAEKRPFITLYRVAEPTGASQALDKFDTFKITYPDGAHNCEGVFPDPKTGDVYFVTKVPLGKSSVYRVNNPAKSGDYKAQFLGNYTFNTGGMNGMMVTGAAVSPDGKHVIVRTYTGAVEFAVKGEFGDWWQQPGTAVKLAKEKQGEAICYGQDGRSLYTSSEGAPCPISRLLLKN